MTDTQPVTKSVESSAHHGQRPTERRRGAAIRAPRLFLASLAAVLVLMWTIVPALAATPPPPNLDGVWQTDDGSIFRITHAQDATSISSQMLKEECTGGDPSTVIQATIDEAAMTMEGTLTLCTPEDHPLVEDCGLAAVWETPIIEATYTGSEISGTRQGEWYQYGTDANGDRTCTFDYNYSESFAFTRLDCGVLDFETLAARYFETDAEAAEAAELAQSFEDGQTLHWTEDQMAPGGLKEKVDAFIAGLARFGYPGARVNSAYRPVAYQAHFADLRLCATQMLHTLIAQPDLGPHFAASVAKINAEIAKHAIYNEAHSVAGLTIKVVFVCYREPISTCPHTDERAVDMTIPGISSAAPTSPNDGLLDWMGALYGMCRPYLYARTPDLPHWEYFGDPFGQPKCNSRGLGPGPGQAKIKLVGESPINLLLTDANGMRIGYDPASGAAVNDFGSDAFYSGPGTEPQLIEVPEWATTPGAWSVTGVGTGDGDYTVTYTLEDVEGMMIIASDAVTGHATANAAITPLDFTVQEDYAPDLPWTSGEIVSSTGDTTTFQVNAGGETKTVEVSGDFTALMITDDMVLALQDDGSGGSSQVVVPAGLLNADLTVRVDGTEVPFTRSEAGGQTTLMFDRPSGATFVTIEGPRPTAVETGFQSLVVTDVQYDQTLRHNIPNVRVTFEGGTQVDAGFLDFYNRTGGLTRWGYPTSEVFEEQTLTLTQYYQRGVVDWKPSPGGGAHTFQRRLAWDYIGGGVAGSPDMGVEPGFTNPNPGDGLGPWGHVVSNTSIEGTSIGFKDFFEQLGGVDAFGFPKSDARFDSHAQADLARPGSNPGFIRQYFQSSVMEYHPGAPAGQKVKLSLLGDTLRDLKYPSNAWQSMTPFQEATALSSGDSLN